MVYSNQQNRQILSPSTDYILVRKIVNKKCINLCQVVISNIKENKSSIKGESDRSASLNRVNGQGSLFEKVTLDKNLKKKKNEGSKPC